MIEKTELGVCRSKHIHMFIFKRILKEIIKVITKPFVYIYFINKFHNIWNLKRYLKENKIESGLLSSYYYNYMNKHNAYIGVNSNFADIPCFPHGLSGVFISDDATVGENCVIFQQVTIGSNRLIDSKSYGSPK